MGSWLSSSEIEPAFIRNNLLLPLFSQQTKRSSLSVPLFFRRKLGIALQVQSYFWRGLGSVEMLYNSVYIDCIYVYVAYL